MRRNSLVQQALLVTAALITATGLAASAHAGTTGTITGTLTAPGGAAVANAAVYLDGPQFKSATTDAAGLYTITGVTPGDYRVRFLPPGRPQQYAFGKVDYSQAAVFTVAADATVTVNDTLLPVGHIAGRLTNPDGSGVAGASVNALPSGSGVYGTTVTAADGTYSVAVLPGKYRIEFHLQSGLRQYAFGTSNWSFATLFEITAPGQTVTVNDTVIATGTLAGRVVTAAGVPVANSQIQISSNAANLYAYTDESGNYRFPQAVPGNYKVSARNSIGMTMYAPQTLSWSEAQLYTVTAGQETPLDITFLPTGTVAGRFTANGVGVAGVSVNIGSETNFASTMTNGNGDYQIQEVFGSAYRVHFDKSDPRISQYATGKVTYETANLFTLTPGTTLTVNDTRLPTGSLRITARNSLTGAQIQEFYADLSPFWGSTQNGVITMTDLPQGQYRASIYGPGYDQVEQQVTITGGQQTDISVSLMPRGTVPVTVVDAATGAPVAGVCVFLQDIFYPTVPDGCDATEEDGRVDLYAQTGNYTMMALPNRDSGYGVQWVGPNGGTGDQRQAANISVVSGQTSAMRTIRLDRAGSIAGRVTSETGQPLVFGEVALLTVSASVGGSGWGTPIESDGSYLLEGLGPYQWPLLLQAPDHAYQWSGGRANRFEATKIQVTAGATATYDHVLKVGTTVVTGTLRDRSNTQVYGWIGAFNSVTGDYAGQAWADISEPFQMRVLSPQQVKFYSSPYWFNGTSVNSAALVSLAAGTNTIHLCAVGASTMRTCGEIGPVRPSPTTPPGGTLPPQRGFPGNPGPANPVGPPAPQPPPGILPPPRR